MLVEVATPDPAISQNTDKVGKLQPSNYSHAIFGNIDSEVQRMDDRRLGKEVETNNQIFIHFNLVTIISRQQIQQLSAGRNHLESFSHT